MIESFLAYYPILVFFLALAGAVFACKAHAQARENGEALRDLLRQLQQSGAITGNGAGRSPMKPDGEVRRQDGSSRE